MAFTLVGNVSGQLTRKIGTSRRGEPLYGDTPEPTMVDVITLIGEIAKTSVRTDSSATRGNAEEEQAQAKILFRVKADPKEGDRFVLHGVVMRIESRQPRIDAFGKLDHWECTLVLWNSDDQAND